MLENDFICVSERALCLQWNSLACQQTSCHSSNTVNVSVNNLLFQTVEVSHGMNLFRLRQHQMQAMTLLRLI